MRLMTMVIFFIALMPASFYASAQTVPTSKFLEKPGQYAVGVRVVEQYDHARVFRHLTDDLGKPELSDASKRRIDGLTPTLATPLWAVRDAPLTAGLAHVEFSAMNQRSEDTSSIRMRRWLI
jgi:hypothetical protein